MVEQVTTPERTVNQMISKLKLLKRAKGEQRTTAVESLASFVLDPSRVAGLNKFVLENLMIQKMLLVNVVGVIYENDIFDYTNTDSRWRSLGNQVLLSPSQIEAYAITYAKKNKLRILEPIFLDLETHKKVVAASPEQRLVDQVYRIGFADMKASV